MNKCKIQNIFLLESLMRTLTQIEKQSKLISLLIKYQALERIHFIDHLLYTGRLWTYILHLKEKYKTKSNICSSRRATDC